MVAALVAFALAGCSRDEEECPRRFDTRAWRTASYDSDERRELAEQVVRCGFMDGARKAEVRRVLGPVERPREEPYRSEHRRWWFYSVGWTNDALGPGDEQNLVITFDRPGRVKRVELSPP